MVHKDLMEEKIMTYRLANTEDIPEMCRIRNLQLTDEGDEIAVDIDKEMEEFFRRKLEDGSLVQFMLEEDGKTIATAGILFIELTPSFSCRTGVRGYVTDMYTSPEYRGRGIATAMLGKLRDIAAERNVTRLMLGASIYGRPVYKKFGFMDLEDWMYMDLDI